VIRDFENKIELNQPMPLDNIGRLINSPMDDFGYYAKEGFFTSNREGGKGDDDIYSFTVPECEQTVEGVVKDQDTQALIVGAKVTLLDAESMTLSQQIVDSDGAYDFQDLDCEQEYLIRIEADTYATVEERFTTPKKQQKLEIKTLLYKDQIELEPCAD
jgi:hypothetical protein